VSAAVARAIVVATDDTAARWARGLRDAGIPAAPCAWSVVAEPEDPAAATRALAETGNDLVVLTSANALRYLGPEAGTGRTAACVGQRTSREAKRAGFAVEVEGRAGAEALARRLAKGGPPRSALWLRGEAATEALASILSKAGWTVREAVAYRAVAVPDLAERLARLAPVSAWVVGSPAAAKALVAALGAAAFPPGAGGPPVVVPGEASAAALRSPGRPPPVVASSVEIDGLAAALRQALG
jgi:uroporphyrinogen-III synthase